MIWLQVIQHFGTDLSRSELLIIEGRFSLSTVCMRKHQEVGSPFCEGVIALGLFVPDATFAVQVLRNGVVYCGFWRLLAPESLRGEE
jgi:hypothetical protein